MANLEIKDFNAAEKHLAATGAGSDVDPHIVIKEVVQDTHDDLNANVTIQVGDTDVAVGNPVPVGGLAAENAAAAGNPNLVGGRYDATPRTLGDGDVGAIALDPDGAVHISDGGNVITVDGTVTITPSGTQNVDVTANTIGLATSAKQLADGHNVVISSELPAGTQNIGDVDIATIAAGDNNIGNVDIASELPAGTQNIGDVDVASIAAGTNVIGKVRLVTALGDEVTEDTDDSVKITIVADDVGIGGGTQYAEDTTHVTGDQVTMAGVVQQTADAALSGDGDRSLLQVDETGYLKVNIKAGSAGATEYTEGATDASITGVAMLAEAPSDTLEVLQLDASKHLQVDIAADSAGLATAAGQLAAGHDVTVDNAAGANSVPVQGDAAENAAVTGNPVLSGGRYDGTPRTLGDGDVGAIALAADGAVHIDDGGNAITVDGTVTADAGTGPWPVTDNAGSLTVDAPLATPVNVQIGDGTDTALVDASGRLSVSIDAETASVTVDQATASNLKAQVDGTVAHDGLDSGGGGPVKIGGRAQEPEAQPEEVADNDRVDALFDRNGYQRVRGDFDPGFADINDASSGDNTIIAAAGSGKRIAVWSVMVVSDGTVDVRFEDGAAGTAFTGQIPLQAREGFTYSAGGLVPLWVGSANTALNLELSAAVNVHGHVSYTVMDD